MAAKLNSGSAFSRDEKLRIRTLYRVKNWQAKDIAEKMGRDPRQISLLVNRCGWAKERREKEDKAAIAMENKAVVDAVEFVESCAIRGEESAMNGFDLADGAAAKRDALAYSAAMSGTKNAIAITRQALGIDSQQAPGLTVTLNAVFGNPIQEPVNVTPKPDTQSLAGPSDANELDFA